MSSLRSNRQFIYLFAGRLVSNVGDSLYFIAAMWIVYDLTGSALYTGLAGFFVQVPRALQFLVGPLVDRWDLNPLLVSVAIIECAIVSLVPLADVVGVLNVWVVLAVMPVVSCFQQFMSPAQSAALPRVVDDENLVKANTLFSMSLQSAEAVFNGVSGILIGVIGAVALFVVNSVTFAVAAVLFFAVTIPTTRSEAEDEANDPGSEEDSDSQSEYVKNLREGIRYVRGTFLYVILLGVMLANVTFGAVLAVLPAYASTFGGAEFYGLLMSAYAGGLVVGTLGSNLVDGYPYGKVCVACFLCSAVALSASLVVSNSIATLVLFGATFVPIGAFTVLYWSILQTTVDNDFLGRVSAFTKSLSGVMLPIGSLVGGTAATVIGVPVIMATMAVALALLGIYCAVDSRIWTLPPPAEATEATLENAADAST